ncbi:MAG: virulence factor TspB C-terminal domain-related protein [Pseudomonadota bacterium]
MRLSHGLLIAFLLVAVTYVDPVNAQGYAGDFWRNNRGNSSAGPFFGSPDAACNALPVTGDLVSCGFVSSGSNGGTCSAYNTRLDTGCDQARRAIGSASIVRNPPDCPEGQEWVLNPDGVDDGSLACDAPPEPDPDPGEECEGESDASGGAIKWTNSGEQSINEFCTPFFSQDQEPCQDVLGYINGHQLCNDDQNECEASGGTYGAAGLGDDVTTAICIPSDFADELPTCDLSTVVVLDQPDPNSLDANFGCSSTIDPPVDSDPTTSTPPPIPDIDGDGIPDYNDGDMDGDGIPNSTDSDADGDGVPDVDDGQVGGSAPDSSEQGTASGGGTCAQRPICSGDAIQCAILWQAWSTRCAIEEPDIPNGFEDRILSGPGTAPEDQVLRDDGDVDLSSPFNSIFSAPTVSGACPAGQSITLQGLGNVVFEWTSICDFANLVRPLVLLVFGWFGVRIALRGFE